MAGGILNRVNVLLRNDELYLILAPSVVFIVAVFVLITGVLSANSIEIFRVEGISLITSNAWIASEEGREFYGILGALYGTAVTSFLAVILSVPIAVALTIMTEDIFGGLPNRIATAVLEFASGIPSIVYGIWGATVLAPALYKYVMIPLNKYLGWVPLFSTVPRGGYSILTAGIILAVMVMPYEALLIKVAYSSLPRTYIEAAYSLGLEKAEVARVKLGMVKHAVVAASLLGLGRAIGETVAVSLVIGNSLYIGPSLLAPGYTVSSLIANQFPNASLYRLMPSALYASALILLLISIPMNMVGIRVMRRAGWST